MPNYIFNTLEIQGIDDITKLPYFEINEFDFNKVIKMPESLNVCDSSLNADLLFCYFCTFDEPSREFQKLKEMLIHTDHYNLKNEFLCINIQKLFDQLLKEDGFLYSVKFKIKKYYDRQLIEKYSIEELGKNLYDNLLNYGHISWYGWHSEYWGTKWNAMDVITDGNCVTFTTAWACPVPILKQISKNHPELILNISCINEENCEQYCQIQAGEDI